MGRDAAAETPLPRRAGRGATPFHRRTMYGSVLTFLIAIAVQALAPRGPGPGWTLAEGLSQLLPLAAAWAALRIRFRRLMGRALHDEAEARSLRASFAATIQGYQGVMLVPFALLLYATHYPGLVIAPASRGSEVLGSTLGVLPYVLLLLVVWWEAYPLQGVLLGREGTRTPFRRLPRPDGASGPGAVAAAHGPVRPPLVALALRASALEANPLLQLLYAPAVPRPGGRLPAPAREDALGVPPDSAGAPAAHLESVCGRAAAPRPGDPLLAAPRGTGDDRRHRRPRSPASATSSSPRPWSGCSARRGARRRRRPRGGPRAAPPPVVLPPLLPRLRVPGRRVLPARRGRARLVGHRRPGGPPPSPDELATPPPPSPLGLLALLFAYFRGLFGSVSRAFERQADAHALEAIGRAEPLTSALERISFFSGDIRDLPSWHHGSIGERIGFLLRAAGDPAVLGALHRRVRRLTRAFGVAAGGAGGRPRGGPAHRLPRPRPQPLRRRARPAGAGPTRNPPGRLVVVPPGKPLPGVAAGSRRRGGLPGGTATGTGTRGPEQPGLAVRDGACPRDVPTRTGPGAGGDGGPPVALAPHPRHPGRGPLAHPGPRRRPRAIDAALAQNPPNPGYYLAQRRKFAARREADR